MGETIDSALFTEELKARYDAACKRLLSEKYILAWIMRSCLEEYRGLPAQVIAQEYIEGTPQVSEVPVLPEESSAPMRIRGAATEDASITEGTVFYDIRFLALAPGGEDRIQLIINLEAQNDFYPGYPLIKRAIYYCSRMISAQHGTEFVRSEYGKIKKVYSIWICSSPPKERACTINRYRLTEEHLVGEAKEAAANYDLLSVVMVCLGEGSPGHPNDVLHLLGTLLSEKATAAEKREMLKTDFLIPMDQKLEGDVSQVCNLGDGLERRSVQKGTEETYLKTIRALSASLGISADKAMALLGVPLEEQEHYRRILLQ